ncbi:MAG: hypothetical protein NZ744_02765 [Pirellulaceae bacterium]|nr:hypothetical protein [Pirellulaceae bacterium]
MFITFLENSKDHFCSPPAPKFAVAPSTPATLTTPLHPRRRTHDAVAPSTPATPTTPLY